VVRGDAFEMSVFFWKNSVVVFRQQKTYVENGSMRQADLPESKSIADRLCRDRSGAIARGRTGARLVVLGIALCLLMPLPSLAEGVSLFSVGVRARIAEGNVLGQAQPEQFRAYDAAATFKLPWQRYSDAGWGVGTRLMTSAGLLRGVGKNALVVSAIPLLAFGSRDGRFTFDMGAGGALLSRARFGSQDYGGLFQFALTLGFNVPVRKGVGAGYRFMHYSDANIYGPDSIGADFHMIELTYRF